MKPSKDRLHKVLVIGATPAGIAATNKLGELRIPVTLVDPALDIDQKLSQEEWRLPTGLSLNYAHRPGLLRILRNPLIQCLTSVEVTGLKHTPQGFRARLDRKQTFIDPNRCVLCGRCTEVCPVKTPDNSLPIQFNGRKSLPGSPAIDKRRQPPCQANCPLGVNAPGYIALARAGRFEAALELVRRDNVLPGICGRVCTHPCEAACRRAELDEPIAIREIKRFLADFELTHPHEPRLPEVERRDEKIAVIGSGPAGLAASADLARLGYQVTVFEKESMAGGLLRYGIGPHRLPRDILDAELHYIERLGVELKTSHPVSLASDLERLKNRFDAVITAVGAWTDRRLGVPGEEMDGVEGCLSFLVRFYRGEVKGLEEKVAVIGDGNAAFDLARTLSRIGAQVTIVSWFPEELIPADADEKRGAREEGIHLIDKTQVVEFIGRNGTLEKMRCRRTEPGEPDANGVPWPVIVPGSEAYELQFNRVVIAIGQTGPLQDEAGATSLNVTAQGFLEVDDTGRTGSPGVFAAGDAVTGPSSVVQAMTSGRKAARLVHRALNGEKGEACSPVRPQDRDFADIPMDIPSLSRPTMPERQPSARAGNFSEVALGLDETQTLVESERCLQCGICSECLLCVEACREIGAINHAAQSEESTVHAGAVIIADPDAAPKVKGEDVIRAYGPKAAKSDVHAMIMRGFAAAARAMTLLGGTSHRPKGRGVSVSPPDPELSPEIRLGVFTCRCNNAFGWMDGMDEYMGTLTRKDDVVHAQIMPAACIPEGPATILRAVREKGLTRIVLASCVCCPLDFVCSACTDQRSRLKDALFKGTGVSRSMVETCNLRGEVLRFLKSDPSVALDRFAGLIERSIHRARILKPLPTPARTYNFTTAVIGESEAAISSAVTLAEAGLDVFMFGTPDRPLSEKLHHPHIHGFEGSSVTGLSGTLGDFQVFVETGHFRQALQVGAVILGENSRKRTPYIPQKGLPSHIVTSSMQQLGVPGVPFLYPGATSIAGLFLANPPGVNISERKKGVATAVLAAAVMPRGPRQSKGFTVVVDQERCRGCGRCVEVCPYQAVTLHKNAVGGWNAKVDEALCKGCGNCISLCPCNAADSPYRDQAYLEQLLEEVLVQDLSAAGPEGRSDNG